MADWQEGDLAHFKKGHHKYGGHYWGIVSIETISPCGRYARVRGRIAWSRHSKDVIVPLDILDRNKPPTLTATQLNWLCQAYERRYGPTHGLDKLIKPAPKDGFVVEVLLHNQLVDEGPGTCINTAGKALIDRLIYEVGGSSSR